MDPARVEDFSGNEEAQLEVFASYTCRSSARRGLPHAGDIAEPSSLSAIPLPPTTYPLWDALPEEIVSQGKLSQLQRAWRRARAGRARTRRACGTPLRPAAAANRPDRRAVEGVLYACSRNQQVLPSGERAAFFIGDGAGVGKGRQISGVIVDNYVRGRRRHVWLSTSSDLYVDASRDMRDLGAHGVRLINGCAGLDAGTRALGLDRDLQEGVLFLTYSTLISAGRGGRSRMDQVLEWLVGGGAGAASGEAGRAAFREALAAWDGVLVFDECHKAKNFTPGKEAQSTKARAAAAARFRRPASPRARAARAPTPRRAPRCAAQVASAVIELQALLPNARVLYCSATGVSEVANMAYMSRCGLWGPASPFPDFSAFLESMRKRGVSFMELLAMEMKATGRYVARGLSFRQAEFVTAEAPLRPDLVRQYDAAVALWQQLRAALDLAAPTLAAAAGGGAGAEGGAAGGAGGGGAGGGKRPGDVMKAYWSGHQRFFKLLCIGLKLDTVIAEAKAALAAGMSVVIGLQSTGEAAADALGLEPGPVPGFVSPCKELLERFITTHFPVLADRQAQQQAQQQTQQPGGGAGALAALRAELLKTVAALDLPANFLDTLIDELGGPSAVAEMTGRKGRVARARARRRRRRRAALAEREAFLAGKKRVALISDAASTGISLHAAATAANRQRRLHLTIELPWSADKAIQQLGRSHRTNQVSAPLYKLVTSAAGGERRFAAAVARRLQSLGALTRGDRRAAAGIDLSDSHFDSPWGRRSLKKMYDHIVNESPRLPNGVSAAALLKDLLPEAQPGGGGADGGAPDGAAAAAAAAAQHRAALRLLQADVPALHALQRLAAAEAAGPGGAAGAAGGGGEAAARGSASPPPAAAAGPGGEEQEALVVAALSGRALPAGVAAAAAARMSTDEVAASVSAFHHELRSCCDVMGIGLGASRGDTVAEDRLRDTVPTARGGAGAGAAPAAAPKASDLGDVRRFLNRLLGLPLGKQNLLFNYFTATLAAEIAAAKAEGRYTEGVSDLQGSSIRLARPPELLWVGAGGGDGDAGAAGQTIVNTLEIDRGVSFEDASRRLAHEAAPGSGSGFRLARRAMWGSSLVLLALQKPGHKGLFTIVRPNTGESVFDMDRGELDEKYRAISPDDAAPHWREQHERSLAACMHGASCANKDTCQIGRRLVHVTVLSGSVVRVWGVLESVLDRHTAELSRADRTLRVVRVAFSGGATAQAGGSQAQAGGSQAPAGGSQVQPRGSQAQSGAPSPTQAGRAQAEGASQQSQQQSQREQETAEGAEQAASPSSSAATPRAGTSAGAGAASPGGAGRAPLAAPPAERHLVGVRFPSQLLPEVVATLASLQEQQRPQQTTLDAAWGRGQGGAPGAPPAGASAGAAPAPPGGGGRSMSAWWAAGVASQRAVAAAARRGGAAAAGSSLTDALGIARIDPPTPVDPKAAARAFRVPKTLASYFALAVAPSPASAAAGAGAGAAAPAPGGGAPRGASATPPPPRRAGSAGSAAAGGAKASGAKAAGGKGAGKRKGAQQLGPQSKHLDCFFKPAVKKARPPEQPPGGSGVAPQLPQQRQQRQRQQRQRQQQQQERSSVIVVGSDSEPTSSDAAGADSPRGGEANGAHGRGAGDDGGAPPGKRARRGAAARAPAAQAQGSEDAISDPATTNTDGGGDDSDWELEPDSGRASPPQRNAPAPVRAAGAGGAKLLPPGLGLRTAADGAAGGRAGGDPQKLAVLQGMGFSAADASRALWVAQGDVSRAVEFALSGCS
ncbi:strawberry notch-like protein [Scenedesmus sp. PABB004]|nr:strawberry notch-like protein [Scenedesmus sp. PABB004]